MSYPIFPSFTTTGTGMNYTWPVNKTPELATTKQLPTSGRGMLLIANRQFPIWQFKYSIAYLIGEANTSASAFQTLMGFFTAVQGAGGLFLFSDPFDNAVTAQLIGTGNGSTTEFSMIRTFGSTSGQDLIQNLNGTPSIYLNGVLQSGSAYTIDQYGNITFNTAPGNTVAITWTGSYYFLCHFLKDSWSSLQHNMKNIWQQDELEFESVLL